MNMLEDFQIDSQLRYANHRLYVKVGEEETCIGGVLGAALLSALLVDTEEGRQRQIAIDTDTEREEWIRRYEREIRPEEWGLLETEQDLLYEAYITIAAGDCTWQQLCPNVRLLDLAIHLVAYYMRYLTIETFGEHIWEYVPWHATFSEWLVEAAMEETKRQRYLQTDWTNAADVTDLVLKECPEHPTLRFEGESAEDIMARYLDWRWQSYRAQLAELPGSKPNDAAHRSQLVEEETNWLFLDVETDDWAEEQQLLLSDWLSEWCSFVTRRLKPEKPIRFWTEEVSEELQDKIISFLRGLEKEWNYYVCLAAAIYALRQMGYVRRACSVTAITHWMAKHLNKDYTVKNNCDQFRRAWNGLSRYNDDVRYFVTELEAHGVKKLKANG